VSRAPLLACLLACLHGFIGCSCGLNMAESEIQF
jgi:hypothetical protein